MVLFKSDWRNWAYQIVFTILILGFLVIMIADFFETKAFVKENGMEKDKLDCKEFCEPDAYWFRPGGWGADICTCRVKEEVGLK